MSILTADAIYTPEGWVRDKALAVDTEGEIQGWEPTANATQYFEGLLIPGWVNAHSHLELSGLKGEIPEGTGMAGFISGLFQVRNRIPEQEMVQAVERELRFLADTGTAAVGDVSNGALSAGPKQSQSQVYSHTFIEILGLAPSEAEDRLVQGQQVAAAFHGLPHSLTPHAPYSTSSALFERIYQTSTGLLSLHLLESKEELELFQSGKGPLAQLYQAIGLSFEPFNEPDPAKHALEGLSKGRSILLVHNLEISPSQLESITQSYPMAWWVLCPRANRYIHGKVPDAELFAAKTERICLGTDSLASNHDLDLWQELKVAHHTYPSLSLHSLIRWATTNGAKALGIDKKFGTFAPQSRPGLLWVKDVKVREDDFCLTPESKVQVLYQAFNWAHKLD